MKLSERLRELAAINRDWNKSAFEAFTDAAEMAQEHEAATGWLPIADAPKNGERHYVGQFAMVSGEWLRYSAAWSNGHWWQDGGRVYPTHYLPSPPPPETKP